MMSVHRGREGLRNFTSICRHFHILEEEVGDFLSKTLKMLNIYHCILQIIITHDEVKHW